MVNGLVAPHKPLVPDRSLAADPAPHFSARCAWSGVQAERRPTASAAMAPPSTTSREELTSDSMCGPVALVAGEPKRVVGLEQPGEDQVESGRLAKLVDDLANDEAPVPLVAVA
jgi:hypothetical protein